MKLSTIIYQYFDQYLPRIKGVSSDTIKTYREAFALFLSFSAQKLSIAAKDIEIEHITSDLIFDFLDYLENERNNTSRTRNNRLATLKSLAKMIRLMHPEYREISEMILNIPQKRFQKKLIGYLLHDEMLDIFETVDLKKKEGFRDYTILNLLYNSGARASEIAKLNLDYFDPQKRTLGILGKGNRYRLIELWPITTELVSHYIKKYRKKPKYLFKQRLFINQRGEEFTRHGIHRVCKKYLTKKLTANQLKNLNPAHSFRHSCAIYMLSTGSSITEIQNHLGHEKTESTMVYLRLNLSCKREVQKKFIEYTQSTIVSNPKIEEMLDWKNKKKILNWLDSL
jgi:integrase/recombinase XerD